MRQAWHQNFKRAAKSFRTVAGQRFDSVAEGKRFAELQLLERAGQITELRRQVNYPLQYRGADGALVAVRYDSGRRAFYRPDFVYRDRDGREIVEEYKGFDKPEARLKRAVFEACYGVTVLVTGPAKRASNKKKGGGNGGRASG